jgi:hypothetical protein
VTTTVLALIPSPGQGVWYLGPVPIRAYALCIIAGIIAALVIGDRRWVARGGERGVVGVTVCAVVSGGGGVEPAGLPGGAENQPGAGAVGDDSDADWEDRGDSGI